MAEVISGSINSGQLLLSKDKYSSLLVSLQQLIQTVVKCLSQLSDNKEEAAALEEKYSNQKQNPEALDIVEKINECIQMLMIRVNDKIRLSSANSYSKEEYRRLEEVLQKHEADNRGYLGENLQNKLTIEQLKARLDQVEKEKQEAVNSIKQHLTQKNKEILSLHKEIESLKKAGDDLKSINENQEFSIRQYESQLQELPQLKTKCKQLQKELDGIQRVNSKKDSFKAINISLNLKKTLNSEIKHSSDTDLSKHINTSASVSNRNRSNIPGSTISTTLGTTQNNNNISSNNTNSMNTNAAKLVTPSKPDRKQHNQSHLLSGSSRGMASSFLDNNNVNTFLSYVQPEQYFNRAAAVSQSQPNQIQHSVQTNQLPNNNSSNNTNTSYSNNIKIQPYIDNSLSSNKQPYLKPNKDHFYQNHSNNNSLINPRQVSHNSSMHLASHNNSININNSSQSHNSSSHNIDTKDLTAYLNGGIIVTNNNKNNSNFQTSNNNNNNSSVILNSSNGLSQQQQQQKRSKSQQASQLKGALAQNNLSGSSARTSSSLNYRHRGLNSSHLTASQEIMEYNNYQPHPKKDRFAETNLAAINASLPNPQISVHPFSSTKPNISVSTITTNNNNNNNNNNNSTSVSQQQMLQQLYVQNQVSRNGYGSSAKRVSSRASQHK